MTGSQRVMMGLVLLGTAFAAQAETVYIAERIRIGLRAEIPETSSIVKTVDTGIPLEIIERFDKLTRVRDPQGAEGWIETRYLSSEPPVRLQYARLQDELASSRSQVNEAQAQLKKAQATIAEQAVKIKELEKSLAEKPAPAPVPLPAAPVAAKSPPVKPTTTDTGFRFSYLWLGISFAMLGIGFAAGVRWLRESIRKRSGGMYLRV
ncbi:MAG: TIGR04211 family SH3 domain-containing protein [Gammaproteobacteria bacterium]|nr:TIGR04211 family SH3 domain-containing protein [Gammaproteobacteria bacterium]MDH3369851.1 TIGR04211 family SH3 domain-containing protein [Gammaproteobacteria bacterium]MDH3407189.1 TIGR04211 family SH3 domain-containing protein [Gammaproteobacteria bacterium]MDH3561847.1 TIGR04211 family SH3 domain-containing protein [Gammaproteobacteria bacterium]MDH5487919.1 TIGR04211 family SH3 domain-containing protein [Gammaproteobacteria bacterium]